MFKFKVMLIGNIIKLSHESSFHMVEWRNRSVKGKNKQLLSNAGPQITG